MPETSALADNVAAVAASGWNGFTSFMKNGEVDLALIITIVLGSNDK